MKKITFGTPEKHVPSRYCKNFSYVESEIKYDVSKITARENARGYTLLLPMNEDEKIYGFGLQLKRFEWSGGKATTRVNADPVAATGDSHAPVPFFVSTAGYGIFFDTLRYAEFNIGAGLSGNVFVNDSSMPALSTDELYKARLPQGESVIAVQIPAAKGVDVYIIEGKNITDIVSQYNMLAAGGCTVPEWGLGVLYRVNGTFTQDKVIGMARYFREHDIPCNIIGLEPGWHSHAYSCTYTWSFRFPEPEKMAAELKEMGYHINLWEHAFVHPDAPFHDEITPYSGDFDVWGGHVPDLTLPEARELFIKHHREKVLLDGVVDGFKLDECDSSDYTGGWSFPNMTSFPSGMDGEQYHSLFGTVYAQTLLEALDGKPTLSEARQMGALAASYPFVLYSDLYDHRDFVRGVVTSGFSGLLWSPEVRGINSKKDLMRRIQTTVFSVQCLFNCWNIPEAPWIQYDCEDEVRYWLGLRMSLVPEIKAAFDTYASAGRPPVRALVMDWTDDENVYGIDDEYMFCDNMLVAPVIGDESDEREVYLPAGEWIDFYTGEKVTAGKFTVKTDKIPVFRLCK